MNHFHISCVLCSCFINRNSKHINTATICSSKFLSTNFVHISNIVCKVHVYANFLKKKKKIGDRNYIEVYLYSFTFLEVLQTIFFLNKLSDFELSLTEVYHNEPVLNLCRVSRY